MESRFVPVTLSVLLEHGPLSARLFRLIYGSRAQSSRFMPWSNCKSGTSLKGFAALPVVAKPDCAL